MIVAAHMAMPVTSLVLLRILTIGFDYRGAAGDADSPHRDPGDQDPGTAARVPRRS
jgi:hypothetical protein